MYRKLFMAMAVAVAVAGAANIGAMTRAMAWGSEFSGPGPEITGNNIGGMFPYRPAPPGTYELVAESFCARYGRLGKVTTIHRIYGDYVSFVCYDRPGKIH